ncbi:hypothetical protein [Sphingobacterium psychroaquaticum]|uniref:Uncharacterized protein n=1 Tax=Sphingobacterium psychroaquaticum TaxID=561061 RepID=A0A1X7K3Y4_9SPHI|nr:hypothetical protein [Sphingobacterium psychroaquaticum]SMG35681.1 hypothetical protein SAMN05660862_2538 [Sphingobacterium psychroaquaticum]
MTLKEEIKWLDSFIKRQLKQGDDVTFLRSILTRLKGLERKELPSPYHNLAMGFYYNWLRGFNLPEIRNPSQGKAMKSILVQLKDASNQKTEESAFESFKVILTHWGRLNVSLQRNKSLAAINKNLLEIIDKIKNGASKQQSNRMEADAFHDRITRKTYGNTSKDS